MVLLFKHKILLPWLVYISLIPSYLFSVILQYLHYQRRHLWNWCYSRSFHSFLSALAASFASINVVGSQKHLLVLAGTQECNFTAHSRRCMLEIYQKFFGDCSVRPLSRSSPVRSVRYFIVLIKC